MKHNLLTLSIIATFAIAIGTSNTLLFAADGHGHDSAELELNESSDKHNDGDEHGGHDEHEEEGGGVELSKAQLTAAGIVVEPLKKQMVSTFIAAPGEVLFNAYQSKKITPRINAQILKRHKRLGQHIKRGDILVSLTSVEMAQAQGELIVADREWSRVKKLGKKVVSDRRYIATKIARQQAYAKVLAFGMTKSQISQLLKSKDISKAVGQFNLLATQSGTIISDDFIEGEIIQPGRVLFEITDESSMWVEAKLTPKIVGKIKANTPATILVNGERFPAEVTQIHHQLDQTTRTIAVRLEVDNLRDSLHPGLFVEAQIEGTKTQSALALPENAVLRSPDGDWAIFFEAEPGHFKSLEVEIISKSGGMVVIAGVEENTPVVTKGAFFVQSEIAKSGFSVHNH